MDGKGCRDGRDIACGAIEDFKWMGGRGRQRCGTLGRGGDARRGLGACLVRNHMNLYVGRCSSKQVKR